MKKQFDIKKLVLLNLPYLLMGLFATNFGEAWRLAQGANASEKFLSLFAVLPGALQSFWPSLHPLDLLVGLCCGAVLRLAVYLKSKNAKKYIHSEKDILKLVTTLIANTKGEGKAGDDFWVKAETLLYCALIGYIHYEAPVEEQNFSTLIEFINAMEVREDDEEFKNPVDLMFDALEAEKPNHFAVRQYKKYKLAAGDICSK